MKNTILTLFSLMFLFSGFTPANETSTTENNLLQVEKTTTFYVYAPSGLNLRNSSDPKSKVIKLVPFGAEVKLLAAAADRKMEVDQIKGGMAKVSYGTSEGYIFDGYLSRFPIPKKDVSIEDYVEKLRDLQFDVYREEIRRDWGGYLQYEETYTVSRLPDGEVPGKLWVETYLTAQQLLVIPKKLLPPPLKSTKETIVVENPDKLDYEWTNELSSTYKDDVLTSISFGRRSEGGGSSITIEYNKDENGLRVSKVGIAD